MEKIETDKGVIEVYDPQWRNGKVVIINHNFHGVTIPKQSIPALIEALKKYQDK